MPENEDSPCSYSPYSCVVTSAALTSVNACWSDACSCAHGCGHWDSRHQEEQVLKKKKKNNFQDGLDLQ